MHGPLDLSIDWSNSLTTHSSAVGGIMAEGKNCMLAVLSTWLACWLADWVLVCWPTGGGIVAEGRLLDLIRRLYCFGICLMKMDVRQESTRHTEAIDSITRSALLTDTSYVNASVHHSYNHVEPWSQWLDSPSACYNGRGWLHFGSFCPGTSQMIETQWCLLLDNLSHSRTSK